MSATFVSTLIAGVKLSTLVRVEDHVDFVQKFDENTGTPYLKPVSKQRLWLGSVDISNHPAIRGHTQISPEEWANDVAGLSAAGTGAYAYGHAGYMNPVEIKGWHYFDYNEWIIGVELGLTGHGNRIDEIEPTKVGQAVEEAAQKLQKFGYSGPINLYLVRYAS